jgi:hypothetical protein
MSRLILQPPLQSEGAHSCHSEAVGELLWQLPSRTAATQSAGRRCSNFAVAGRLLSVLLFLVILAEAALAIACRHLCHVHQRGPQTTFSPSQHDDCLKYYFLTALQMMIRNSSSSSASQGSAELCM